MAANISNEIYAMVNEDGKIIPSRAGTYLFFDKDKRDDALRIHHMDFWADVLRKKGVDINKVSAKTFRLVDINE